MKFVVGYAYNSMQKEEQVMNMCHELRTMKNADQQI